MDLGDDFVGSHTYAITPGPYFMLRIKDTGAGMDKQILEHLFEPFFTTKDIGKGTGLGLASVYGSIKSHNGYIDVESTPGQGTTFTMYIPSTRSLRHTRKLPPAVASIPKGAGKVMVVDDEVALRDALREMLLWLGYDVVTCGDGSEAVKYFQVHYSEVDLVILDMIMPGGSGRECFRQLRDIDKNARVILATGCNVEEEEQKLYNEGLAGILRKPFVSHQLAKIVAETIAIARREKAG
jgi:CheY-like chemotaxis protein